MPKDFNTYLCGVITEELSGCTVGAARFFTWICHAPFTMRTSADVAQEAGVPTCTLMDRFARAGVPTIAEYFAWVRLAKAARLLENPSRSIESVGKITRPWNPNGLRSHIATLTGMSGSAWRQQATGDTVIMQIREQLLIPYRRQWRRFDPYSVTTKHHALAERIVRAMEPQPNLVWSPRAVAQHFDVSRDQAHVQLTELTKAGRVQRVGWGKYALPEKAA